VDLLRSNAALQLFPNQKWWDILIPVYFGKPDLSLDFKQVGALLIQVNDVERRRLTNELTDGRWWSIEDGFEVKCRLDRTTARIPIYILNKPH
jgi:hypothetical protein